MNRPEARDGLGEHYADGGRLNHQAEGLIVVDIGPLGEAAKNPASLVPFQDAIGVKLVLEYPFVGDDVGVNMTREKLPSVVGDQSIRFFFHGTTPGWVGKGDANGGGHRRKSRQRGGRHVRKPRFTRVVIGWGLTGGAVGMAVVSGSC
jgi:hypothetical protein